jgi:flavin reductase (DIM6/NTAB) family NADH-FMN oxidoreductase RutF
VRAPLIRECLADIECRVLDIIERYNIVVLEGIASYTDASRKEKRLLHAVGDGTFIIEGRRIDRREMRRSKVPTGV